MESNIIFIDDPKTIQENAEKILAVPSFSSELKPYQLDEVKKYITTQKRILLSKYLIDWGEYDEWNFLRKAEPFPSLEDHKKWVYFESMEDALSPDRKEDSSKKVKRIEWLGSQKQLAELFIELKQKGWIDEHNADTLKACFTKTDTIQQVLKPATDKKTKESTYEHVYTPGYKPMFYGIKKLP